jgi:predicted RNase H-like nuclease
MLILGLDLAWGARATTGACALGVAGDGSSAARLLDLREALTDDADIVGWIAALLETHGEGGCLLAVDAPLHVPNETGDRPCDSETRRRFARHHAGPHPANRGLLGADPRGERLVRALAPFGFMLDARIGKRQSGVRQIFEAFPHPAHVVLFGRNRILPYKAKSKRTLADRHAAFAEYGNLLRRICVGERVWLDGEAAQSDEGAPRVALPDRWPLTAFPSGSALKRYEDGLDAFTCAYIAHWCWWFGPEGMEIFGDPCGGHIVTPRIPEGLRGPDL